MLLKINQIFQIKHDVRHLVSGYKKLSKYIQYYKKNIVIVR